MVEELDCRSTDHGGAGLLLGRAHLGCLCGSHAVDAGLAAGGEQLDHVLALRAPAGQCARGTELEVVGMGDDGQAGVPVLRHRFERGAIHGARRYRSRSEEHTSELQSLMRISYAVFCLKKKQKKNKNQIMELT